MTEVTCEHNFTAISSSDEAKMLQIVRYVIKLPEAMIKCRLKGQLSFFRYWEVQKNGKNIHSDNED